ncbi:MAG: GyrI-like domain-containing protein, partial [Rhodobacteraceae bacterium]|nr:GyrI-like domain-containing protein [Paracoccaceae bacterium]
LAGGRTAVLTYKGPYDGLEAPYRYLYGTWLAQVGAVPSGQPPYEIYLNSPEDTAPEDLLTAIHVPLAEAQT